MDVSPDVARQIEELRAVIRRRELFAAALTPEVLRALAVFFGVDGRMFAFDLNDTDPVKAVRTDTLMGVIRCLRFETNPASLEAARADLNLIQQDQSHA